MATCKSAILISLSKFRLEKQLLILLKVRDLLPTRN